MNALTQIQIAPPADWQAFERASVILWQNILGDLNLKKFGKLGQQQHGLDLTGYKNGDSNWLVGIQCKCITRPKKLDEKTVREETAKAAAFDPPLKEYIITTTADDDASLDALAHQLTASFQKAGRNLLVRVFGWGSLQERIQQYPAVYSAFDPSHSPAIEAVIQSSQELQRNIPDAVADQVVNHPFFQDLKRTLETFNHPSGPLTLSDQYDHAELDRYRSLINKGQISAAFTLIRDKTESLGSAATNTVKSRLKALEGHCLWQMDKIEEAQSLFEEAFRLAPDEKKGIAAGVLAQVVVGKYEVAYELALKAIKDDPNNEAVVPLLFMSAARTVGANDPASLVADSLRNEVAYCEGYVDFLRGKCLGNVWWPYAREKAEAFADSFIIQVAAADSQLDEFITLTDFKTTGRVSDEWRIRLLNAAELLTKKKESIELSENKKNPVLPSLACNLALIYTILDRQEEANSVVKSALELFHDDADLIERAAQATLDFYDEELEAKCLAKLRLDGNQLVARILILSARGNWASLAALSDAAPISKLSGSDGEMARLLVRAAVVRLMPKEEQDRALKLMISDDSIPREHFVAVSDLASQLGYDDLAEMAYQIAKDSIVVSSHIAARLNFARIAESREDWRAVVNILYGHLDTAVETVELRMLARAFVNAYPITEKALQFFAELPESIRFARSFLEMEAILSLKSGDNKTALNCVSKALVLDPTSARLILLKYQIFRRANLLSDCDILVGSIESNQVLGKPIELMQVAHLFAMHGKRGLALERGYRILMQNLHDPKLELLYCGLFLNWPDTAEGNPSSPELVSDGCWVRTRDQHGQEDKFLIDSSLSRTREIVWPVDERAAQIQGLAVGAHITLGIGPMARTITVHEIKHRYLHALHETMSTFSDRYPGNTGMQKLVMQEGDIEPFLAMLRQRAEEVGEIADRYKRNAMPIVLMGQLTSPSPIDFMEFLESQKFGIKTCEGTGEERARAAKEIELFNNRGTVLDLTALWTILRLDCFDIIKLVFGKISVPECAQAKIIHLRDEAKDRLKHKGGTAGFSNGRYFLIEFKEHETQDTVSRLDGYLAQIANFTDVRPAVAPAEIDNNLARLLEGERSDDFMDAAFLSRAQNAILLSEDMVYRHLAKEAKAHSSCWLQPVFAMALNLGLVDLRRYVSLVVRLAGLRHGYLSLDAKSLFNIAKFGGSDFDVVAPYIGSENADLKSHISVVAEFAEAVLKSQDKSLRKALSKLVANLVLRIPDRHATVLAGIVVMSRNHSLMRKYLRWWCANRNLAFRPVTRKLTAISRQLERQA